MSRNRASIPLRPIIRKQMAEREAAMQPKSQL